MSDGDIRRRGHPRLLPWIALGLLLDGNARAEEPPAQLAGRVFELGSITALPGARVHTSTGTTVITDGEGRFSLTLPAGETELLIEESEHLPLRLRERLRPGQSLTVEYRLAPRPQTGRYRTVVRGSGHLDAERFTLRDEELRQTPGSLGDPFRAIALLPGVGQPLPLLPLFVVRGAAPGGTGFFLDGMRVPQLFHLLIGGGVVHSRLIDRLDFQPGAWDATHGRFAGAIVDAETRPARDDGQHGELELRLHDVSALVELSLPKGVRVAAAGHYGYPGLLLRLVSPGTTVDYWDYTARLDWRGLTVEALGSFDTLRICSDPTCNANGGGALSDQPLLSQAPNPFRLTFHRLQVRDRERLGPVDLEAALVGGIDELSGGASGVRKIFLALRANMHARMKWFRLSAGIDAEVSRFTAEKFIPDAVATIPDELGDFAGSRNGVVAGLYVQGAADLFARRLELVLGGRIDVYHAGTVTLVGLDPRASARLRPLDWLSLHAGFGLYQQPPGFPLPLPGLDTFSLQLGLQRAWQGAAGVEVSLPRGFSASATGFYHRYLNLTDTLVSFTTAVCTSPPPESLHGFAADVLRLVDGSSMGMEVLVRRRSGRVTGWVAYTLSRSMRVFSCGLRPSDFDQTHVLNVVVQARLPWKLMAGARLLYSTGRPATVLQLPDYRNTVRNNTRLPGYLQIDLRLDREWLFNRWALAVFVELLNLTYSESVYGLGYAMENGVPRYDQPQTVGFRWILPSVGVRGRF